LFFDLRFGNGVCGGNVFSGRSCIPRLLIAQISAIFMMLSCASSQPLRRITVHTVPEFTGTLRISTCVSGTSGSEISADAQGMASTSLCPGQNVNVEIMVVQGSRQSVVAHEDVSISRTGDGIPTTIKAEVRR
jgi:hypothetical protein